MLFSVSYFLATADLLKGQLPRDEDAESGFFLRLSHLFPILPLFRHLFENHPFSSLVV